MEDKNKLPLGDNFVLKHANLFHIFLHYGYKAYMINENIICFSGFKGNKEFDFELYLEDGEICCFEDNNQIEINSPEELMKLIITNKTSPATK